MVLSKKTHYSRSISLTHEEFEAARQGLYVRADIDSEYGKRIASVPGPLLKSLCLKAKLLLVDNDPGKPHFWLLNF
jgi:hypothetical protein